MVRVVRAELARVVRVVVVARIVRVEIVDADVELDRGEGDEVEVDEVPPRAVVLEPQRRGRLEVDDRAHRDLGDVAARGLLGRGEVDARGRPADERAPLARDVVRGDQGDGRVADRRDEPREVENLRRGSPRLFRTTEKRAVARAWSRAKSAKRP